MSMTRICFQVPDFVIHAVIGNAVGWTLFFAFRWILSPWMGHKSKGAS